MHYRRRNRLLTIDTFDFVVFGRAKKRKSGAARKLNTLWLFVALSAASLLTMIVIDAILGPEAEFLNAYSVVLRIIGQIPSARDSLITQQFGAVGELVLVLIANLVFGGVLTVLVRLPTKR